MKARPNGLGAVDAIAFLTLLYQPRLRVLLATLGRADVQRALAKCEVLSSAP